MIGLLALPALLFAKDPGSPTPETPETKPIINPLGDIDTPEELIIRIIRQVLGLIGILSVAMFIYGGLMMVMSGGNTETIKKARQTLIWASLGVLIVLSSYSIMKYVFDVFQGST